MNKTAIEWTDYTWNPIRARRADAGGEAYSKSHRNGTFCTRISPGCQNCYASAINKRFGNGLDYTVPNLERVEFFLDEKILQEPLKLKKPSKIFVGDMFDLFHEAIPVVFLGRVFGMMAKCPQHTFQLLTKRAEYMQAILSRAEKYSDKYIHVPLPNVWLGVSVESQKYADERIPLLQQTPAAIRFLSIEPQLEQIEISGYLITHNLHGSAENEIDWVICGGESGPGARPMHPNWARSLRDQCAAASVPFFFKQWGEWQPHPDPPDRNGSYHGGVFLLEKGDLGNQGDWREGWAHAMNRVGKKKAGALLDGREWREFPAVRETVSA